MNRDVVRWCALGVILCVADVFGEAQVTLRWTAPGGDGRIGQASVYDLRYSLTPLTDANWATATPVWGLPAPKASGMPETTIVVGLANSTTYYFAIKSGDEVPNWSVMSNVVVRTTPPAPPPAPVLASPTSGATGVSTDPTLDWNASIGATAYEVQVSVDPAYSTMLIDSAGVVGTSLTLTGLADSTLYYWHVKASNSGGSSSYSSNSSFKTLAKIPTAPLLVSPASGATGISNNALLMWTLSPGASSYRVQVSTDTSFASPIADLSNIIDTSVVASGLAVNTLYYWRVSASSNRGTSPYSAVRNFTTIAELPPVAPILVSPANGATNVYMNPVLVWNATDGTTAYHVQLSASQSFGSLTVDQNAVTDTFLYVSSLRANTTYYWRVSASNSGGSGPYTATQKFRTGRKKKYGSFAIGGSTGKSDGTVPDAYELRQNYPNPFNPSTQIEFDLPTAGEVRLDVFNSLGQIVCNLINEPLEAGTHMVTWNARSSSGSAVASGVYFYRLVAGDYVATRKMMLLR